MPRPAGTRSRGPKRPDPAMAAPELRVWAALMRRVHDELYQGLEPTARPTVTALARSADLSVSYVSESFSGKKRPRLVPFLCMVEALGGDRAEWEPRWHKAWAEQPSVPTARKAGPPPAESKADVEAEADVEAKADVEAEAETEAEAAPAPGAPAATSPAPGIRPPGSPPPGIRPPSTETPQPEAPEPDTSEAGSPQPDVLAGAGLRRYPLRRLVRAVVAWVVMAVTWPVRARRDSYAIRLRRRLVKQVRDRTAVELGRAEVHHYLTPRFTVLTEPAPVAAPTPRGRRGAKTRPAAAPVPVPTHETDVRALYGKSDELVVLGKPGMGKTTQLARLAHRLAVEALEGPDDREPLHVPVYLRLDTYRGEPMEEWLVAAMSEQYRGVSGVLVRTWLSEHRLLPVLDGLDEVPEGDRRRCVTELRRLRRSCPGTAVGCRTDEADLRRLAEALRALRYVEIEPPSERDVEEFLEADRDALADVRAALEQHPDLWPLFRSPMMLNFIRLTYRNRPADDLHQKGSLEERRSRIFDAYTRECLRRDRPRPDGAPERTLTWLTSLARTLTARKEHVLYLDRLDLTWLSPREQILPKVVPTVAMASCALGLPVAWLAVAVRAGLVHTGVRDAGALALAMAVNVGTQAYQSEKHFLKTRKDEEAQRRTAPRGTPQRRNPQGRDARRGTPQRRNPHRGAVTVPMMTNAPMMLLILWWLLYVAKADLTSPGCLLVGLAYLWVAVTQMEASYTQVFQPVEQMRWTWRQREMMVHSSPLRHFLTRGMLSVVVWTALICLLGYVLHLLCPDPTWLAPTASLFLGTVYVFGNQFEPSLQERRPRPNEGIRRSARFALVHGLVGLVVGGLGLLVLIGLAAPGNGLHRAVLVASLLGALFAVVRGFRFGGLAVVRHWTIRVVLAHRGRTPYRFRRFLHGAEERVLLHRTDSGYFFPHRLLQLHLNTTTEEILPRITRAPQPAGPA
ncbi:NACHT domain-containing NTPase [Streptomyces sp. WAC06614]|uniref:NACHT domain-containing protein n=1 Tax=Streptomyces sp. WAC06614 TaxID=2487416 RepID=UPI000F77B6EA|nr:NACHT domain-containing protein [Streptomyces sp. WAC06614]RSS80080.1 NACHT domain-containing protein [Streptomyces sp. WAC06614]